MKKELYTEEDFFYTVLKIVQVEELRQNIRGNQMTNLNISSDYTNKLFTATSPILLSRNSVTTSKRFHSGSS